MNVFEFFGTIGVQIVQKSLKTKKLGFSGRDPSAYTSFTIIFKVYVPWIFYCWSILIRKFHNCHIGSAVLLCVRLPILSIAVLETESGELF